MLRERWWGDVRGSLESQRAFFVRGDARSGGNFVRGCVSAGGSDTRADSPGPAEAPVFTDLLVDAGPRGVLGVLDGDLGLELPVLG